jgi:ribosomal-protein-alanine N-acetyltransferase
MCLSDRADSGRAGRAGLVELLDVTDHVLEELLEVALTDAAPDDVTPPLWETDGWNPERIGWFRDYHRGAAAGLDGPAAQKTWAICSDGRIAGSIRLRRAREIAVDGGALETGLWLGRSFRGRGLGREALNLVCTVASREGAAALHAETTAGNFAAKALLRSAGGELAPNDASAPGYSAAPVTARISLR